MTRIIIDESFTIDDSVCNKKAISLEEAKDWVLTYKPLNHTVTQITKALGFYVPPAESLCDKFTIALQMIPRIPLLKHYDYMIDEILDIGVECNLVYVLPVL